MSEMQKAVPDRLAEVRAALRKLEAEEESLRQVLLADPSARIGADWSVVVREVTVRRVQSDSLKAADPELWERLAVSVNQRRVELTPRVGRAA
jgi:hypothetical protein